MKGWSQHQIDCLNVMGITQWKNKNKIESEKSAQSVDPLLSPLPNNKQKQSKGLVKNSISVNRESLNPSDEIPHFITDIADRNYPEETDKQPQMGNWKNVQDGILNCQSCTRCKNRQQAIVGEGNKNSNLFIITDVPSQADDIAAKIYSGEVGELFGKMLNAIDIKLDSIYMSPFVKCFQANNQSVHVDEFEHCLKHLQQQINLVKPNLLLIFSESAAQIILKNQSPLSSLRQQVHLSVNQIKTIVTYSPNLILADASKKRDIWEDLKFAKKTMTEYGMHV